MNITIHNCESFFLDYYEKVLSPVEVAEVLFFLEDNPDLKEVFEEYEAVFLEQEKIHFPDKKSLKKKYNRAEIDSVLSSEISETNYEQFFVANTEGILTEIQNQKLSLFIIEHPELKKEFKLFQKCKLTAERISFDHKNLLKKETINIHNREEYFIRAIENDLNPVEQKQFAAFLQINPQYKNEFIRLKKTILEPEKIKFEFKAQLKKKEKKPVFVYIFSQRNAYYGIAATILLLMGLFYFIGNNENKTDYFAEKNTSLNSRAANVKSQAENNILIEKVAAKNENVQVKPQEPISVNKNSGIKHLTTKEEIIISQPDITKDSKTENLIAEQPEEKKLTEEPIQKIVASKTTEVKKDSTATTVAAQNVSIASITASLKKDEYLTVASFVNKKVRSILGIKNSTECETADDKISLWDLAMVAKKGVQKIIGEKTLDVNKVCEGSGEKIEYIFTAGNFQISKSASK